MIQETFFQKYDTLIDKALGIGNLHGQSQEKQLCPFYRELFVKLILLLRVHTKLEMVSKFWVFFKKKLHYFFVFKNDSIFKKIFSYFW